MRKYDPVTGHIDFSLALEVLKRGQRVKRSDWGDTYVALKDKGFYMWHRDRDVAWVPTWEEMLATDWLEVV